MVLFDNHTHSHHSPDSRMNMITAAEKIRELSFRGICFSDHYDFDPPKGIHRFTFHVESQQSDIEHLKKSYPDLELLKGVEIGIQPVSMEAIDAFMKNHTFDTVIASMHFVRGHDPYHGKYYDTYEFREAYGIYLRDILDCIQTYRDFDILGHFDYIARYSPYREHTISLDEFGDILDPVLRILAETGKTFEINTKTYQPFAHGTPVLDTNILKRFRELGGEAVSLGSDAHSQERIGEQFDYYSEVLKHCGFRYGVYYKKREPVFYAIDN
ncbi:MAG TPA: histidinol-phosphatase HisJ family protein [Bacteroidales bacterium]|nr:histidinol-phosphatase HisJ family protein [Bacteroidales bacterium]HRW94646.1 histidinol-phosphatase HisJ family protein [Bacteroidales bacterium]